MKKQRNLFQMKEQNESTRKKKNPNETETGNSR